MKKSLTIFIPVAVLAGLLWMGGALMRKPAAQDRQVEAATEITVFCAAGLMKPVQESAQQFTGETGITINFQFGGSATLLSQLQAGGRADVFIAADRHTVDVAHEKGLVREVLPIVEQTPVIAFTEGNPQGIAGLRDLLSDKVRLGLANPEAASIGKASRAGLGDQWGRATAKVTVMSPTVTELATALRIQSIDASILWDSTARQFDGLAYLQVPELDAQKSEASVCVTAESGKSGAALRFARYLAAADKSGPVFEKHGFVHLPGDEWAEKPHLILYSGGVNRPAIENLLNSFQSREGIEMTTVFNGCGILCAAMDAMTSTSNPRFPDAYYACDLCFVPPVAEHFPQVTILTETDIGIAVPEGNPKQIRSLIDLARPGVRVGICNAKQSTLGYMTDGILRDSGLLEAVRENVVVEVPTADFLINQMRGGALDACIVYRVNADLQAAHVDFSKIQHPGAVARQPFSVRGDSPRSQLATRLLEHLLNNEPEFTQSGFIWLGGGESIPSKDLEVPPWLVPGQAATFAPQPPAK